jgi:hypothetical protein
MMQSLSPDELSNQLTEQHTKYMNKFFSEQFKYSFRHQRLISLLEQLKQLITSYNNSDSEANQNDNSALENNSNSRKSEDTILPHMFKPSPSIDFFMLYVTSTKSSINTNTNLFNDLDKEWFYNMVRSACCYVVDSLPTPLADNELERKQSFEKRITANDLILDSSSLKSKQCALMLSNLDFSNLMSILQADGFKLSLIKDCILLGAQRFVLIAFLNSFVDLHFPFFNYCKKKIL